MLSLRQAWPSESQQCDDTLMDIYALTSYITSQTGAGFPEGDLWGSTE